MEPNMGISRMGCRGFWGEGISLKLRALPGSRSMKPFRLSASKWQDAALWLLKPNFAAISTQCRHRATGLNLILNEAQNSLLSIGQSQHILSKWIVYMELLSILVSRSSGRLVNWTCFGLRSGRISRQSKRAAVIDPKCQTGATVRMM